MHPIRRLSGDPSGLSALVLCLLILGCELTPSDVYSWKDIKDGDRKLAAVVLDPSRDMKLRITAARTMGEMGAVLQLADALQQSEERDQQAIVEGLLPHILLMFQSSSETAQVDAKDLLYYVGGYLAGESRDRAAQAIVDWAFADFEGRFRKGKTTLAQVLPSLGTAAVPQLFGMLKKGQAIPEVAEILGKINIPKVTDAAAELLIEHIRQQPKQRPPEVWFALDRLTTQLAVPFLLESLANPELPDDIKDVYFDHLVRCGGPKAANGMAALLADHKLRWHAAEHLIALDGLGGLSRVLSGLPAKDKYEEQVFYDEAHFFCAHRLPEIKDSKDAIQLALLKGLSTRRPLASSLAAHCLELHGTKQFAGELRRHQNLAVPVPGWKTGTAKLGDIVRKAVQAMEKRSE